MTCTRIDSAALSIGIGCGGSINPALGSAVPPQELHLTDLFVLQEEGAKPSQSTWASKLAAAGEKVGDVFGYGAEDKDYRFEEEPSGDFDYRQGGGGHVGRRYVLSDSSLRQRRLFAGNCTECV